MPTLRNLYLPAVAGLAALALTATPAAGSPTAADGAPQTLLTNPVQIMAGSWDGLEAATWQDVGSAEGTAMWNAILAATATTVKASAGGWESESVISDTIHTTPPQSRFGAGVWPGDTPWLVVTSQVRVNKPNSPTAAARIDRKVVSEGKHQDEWPYINASWGAYENGDSITAWSTPTLSTALEQQAWRAAGGRSKATAFRFTPTREGGWDLTDIPYTPSSIAGWSVRNNLTPWGVVLSVTDRKDLQAAAIRSVPTQSGNGNLYEVVFASNSSYVSGASLWVRTFGQYTAAAKLHVDFPDPFTPGEESTSSIEATVSYLGDTVVPVPANIPDSAWVQESLRHAASWVRKNTASSKTLAEAARVASKSVPMRGVRVESVLGDDEVNIVVKFANLAGSSTCSMRAVERGNKARIHVTACKPDTARSGSTTR